MGPLIDSLLRRLTRAGFRRGLAGESWAWLLLAGAAYVMWRARRPDVRTERIDLQPDARYLVWLQPPRKRRGALRHDDGWRDEGGHDPWEAENAYRPHPTIR